MPNVDPIERVSVLGAGILGTQIAFQAAFHGHQVLLFDKTLEAAEAGRRRIAEHRDVYPAEVPGVSAESAAAAADSIRFTTDLGAAVRGAHLVIEAVTENLAIKRELLAQVSVLVPGSTVIASNSSTFVPSAIKDVIVGPERYLHLHFANRIWVNNLAEISGSRETHPGVLAQVTAFAEGIGMVAVQLRHENPGYLFNALLLPLLDAAAKLWMFDLGTPEDIDRTWKIGLGVPMGPFEIFDLIGLNTAYEIASTGGSGTQYFAARIKREFLDHGKLGRSTGEGFHCYPPSLQDHSSMTPPIPRSAQPAPSRSVG